ncbi:MAG: phage tail tube protein [Parabacteroides sp.]|nr:phage tail tube protein [Parabacteroides sp.]
MTLAYAWQEIVTTYISAAGVSTVVGEVTTVPSPSVKRDTIEVTSQSSHGFKEFINGMKEGDEIEFKMNDISSDPGQMALSAAATAGETGTIVLTFLNGQSVSFPALIEGFYLGEDSKAASNSCKMKITGDIVRSTTPVQLSALTTTAGTLLPTFAAGTYLYTVTATTATVTVTPTSVGASIMVNGTTVASGSPSGAINVVSGGVKEINIAVSKAGSTPSVYKIVASKAT